MAWTITTTTLMPNKAKSQSQFRFLKGVAEGTIKSDTLSRKEAKELLGNQSPKGLPEKAKRKKD